MATTAAPRRWTAVPLHRQGRNAARPRGARRARLRDGEGLPFLSDAIAKAAIGKDLEVASSFVSAFAPVVHRQAVRVSDVKSLPETTGVTLVRDMKHDIALRYSIGGVGTAVMEVVPQHYNRAMVEIQRQPEKYLPGRALAHASGHYLAAINEEAKVVKAEKRRAVEVEEEAKRAANKGGAAGGGPQARRKSPSKEPRVNYDSTVARSYSEKEMADLELFLEREADKAAGKERALQVAALEQVRASAAAALEQERASAAKREAALLSSAAASAAALEQERALAAKREAALRSSAAEREAALERERALAAAALKQERASAAAALKQERSSAAEREAALRAELERQKGAVSGTP